MPCVDYRTRPLPASGPFCHCIQCERHSRWVKSNPGIHLAYINRLNAPSVAGHYTTHPCSPLLPHSGRIVLAHVTRILRYTRVILRTHAHEPPSPTLHAYLRYIDQVVVGEIYSSAADTLFPRALTRRRYCTLSVLFSLLYSPFISWAIVRRGSRDFLWQWIIMFSYATREKGNSRRKFESLRLDVYCTSRRL